MMELTGWEMRAVDLLTRLFLFLGRLAYRIRIEGLENLPARGPYILSTNEISQMGSAFTTMVIVRLAFEGRLRDLVGFGAEDTWHNPFLIRLYPRTEVHPVLPGRGQSVPALLAALETLRAGKVVAMNPEGEMSWDGRIVPFKPGVAWLALRSGVPVVPLVSTRGAYEVWPRWSMQPRFTGRFAIRLGRPIHLADGPLRRVEDDDLVAATRRLTEEIQALIYD
jgi:1-acyl-sn-glycerol-3-phosphate acyltransferase